MPKEEQEGGHESSIWQRLAKFAIPASERETVTRTQLSEALLFLVLCTLGVLSTMLKVASLIIYANLGISLKASYFGITGTDIAIVVFTMLLLVINRKWHVAEVEKSSFAATESHMTMWQRLQLLWLMLINLFSSISTIVIVADTSDIYLSQNHYFQPKMVAVICLIAIDAACNCAFFMFVSLYSLLSFTMMSQIILIMTNFFEVFVAVVATFINSSYHMTQQHQVDDSESGLLNTILSRSRAFPYFFLVIIAAASLGVIYGAVVNPYNRLTPTLETMGLAVLCGKVVSACVCVTYFGLSLANVGVFAGRTRLFKDILIADPILSFCGILLNGIGIYILLKLQKRPASKLRVESYHLSDLKENERLAWASMIDRYSQMVPGSPSGKAALSLMEAYANSPMKNLHCKVLRVYDKDIYDAERQNNGVQNNNHESSSPKYGERYYEKIRAWDKLDQAPVFEDDSTVTQYELAPIPSQVSNAPPPNSKNAKKRAEKKAAKKAQRQGKRISVHEALMPAQDEDVSQKDLEEEFQFRATLMATEALILLTYVDNYDLVSNLDSSTWYGRLAQRMFGINSPFKLLCVRMGLLATHWPFREAIFYTSPAKKPKARAAAVLRAVADWNKKLPRSQRCTMLIYPMVSHYGTESVLNPAGWQSISMPPSHVVDLRRFQGSNLKDYLKAIKYRNQAVTFNKAHGEVIESKDFSTEECALMMELWHNIASKRTSEGHTAVLVEPTAEFVRSLGTVEHDGLRSLLMLKVDGQCIASCVLFRLGDTITSDLQGLDHELGRHYKAYFVMMQETIAIALREGIKFVDFGPTTSKPKIDIGAKEIELVGGISSHPPLSWCISAFASNVDSG